MDNKKQEVIKGSLLIGFTVVALVFLPMDIIQKCCLGLIGGLWIHFYHKRDFYFSKKYNRFSFFWFLMKVYKLVAQIPRPLVREFILVLIPFVLVKIVESVSSENSYSYFVLVAAVIVQISWMIRRLVSPVKE